MIDESAPLAPLTTLRIGGPAKVLVTPESEDELIACYRRARESGAPLAVLGRGSNVLVRDEGFAGTVIRTTEACKELRIEEWSGSLWWRRCRVYAGTSVTLQSLIRFCIANGLEAPTYLHSVPGNVGGAIYMNAGTGITEGRWVSQRLVRVKAFDGRAVRWLSREECRFEFRESAFFGGEFLILGAEFDYPRAPRRRMRREVRQRTEFVRRTQDTSLPNAGSVFKTGYKHFRELEGYRIGGAMFSRKSGNWIVNLGGATCADVLALIDHARCLHVRTGLPEPVVEYRVFP